MKPVPSIITIDFETYSEAGYKFDKIKQRWVSIGNNRSGITAVGAYIYAIHPSTRVISLSYGIPGTKKISLWIPGMPNPDDLLKHVFNKLFIEAHNANFEYYIWTYCCIKQYGWPSLSLDQLICSAAKARASGLPSGLSKLSKALGSIEQKDTRGTQLIKLLSCPRNPIKNKPELITRRLPHEYPQEFSEMYLYNIQDVKTTIDISQQVEDLSLSEQKLFELDLDINHRGIAIDLPALEGCIKEYERLEKQLTDRLIQITKGKVNTHAERDKIIAWLASQEIHTSSLAADQVSFLLKKKDLPEEVKEVLLIRQNLAISSVKKLYSIKAQLDNHNRIHDLYLFYGARTGRFTARGAQFQNLPRGGTKEVYYCEELNRYSDSPDLWNQDVIDQILNGHLPIKKTSWGPEVVDYILTTVSDNNLEYPLNYWKDSIRAISGSLRGLIVAGPGCELISSDYSSIEALVLAELAGETWRQEVFQTHGKIYEKTGSKITGVPFDKITKDHPARMIGKVAELAAGYGGWIGSWKSFGADKYLKKSEIRKAAAKWRTDSPTIVELWGGQWRKNPYEWSFEEEYYGLEGMAIQATLYPEKIFKYRYISYQVQNDILWCKLPSGRKLAYRKPCLKEDFDYAGNPVFQLSFKGMNRNPKYGKIGWIRMDLYGGRLTENVTQATARDIFTAAMLRINNVEPYKIVLHTHDEITAEVPEGKGSIEEFEKLMCVKEPWFRTWPIKVSGGWRGKRYRK